MCKLRCKLRCNLRHAILAFAMTFPLCVPAFAQEWPTRPISLIVAFAPGGSTDLIARMVALKLKGVLGQTVVVENKAGAGGSIGAGLVTKAAPDGYTLLLATGSLPLNQVLNKNIPFDIRKDLLPVIQIAYQPLVLVVHKDFAVKTLPQFVTYVRDARTPLNYASAGSGSTPHLAGALLNYALGDKMVHVPYQGGGPAAVAVLSRQVDCVMSAFGEVIPHIKSGDMIALGVTTNARSPSLPDVPTLKSAIPDWVEMATWHGIMVPANTPAEIVNRLNAAMKTVLKDPEVQTFLGSLGGTVVAGSPEDFRQMIAVDLDNVSRLVKLAGVTAQ